jgi:hypothetical protein
MRKFQIVEINEKNNDAGTKANADIADIAEKLGYQKVLLRTCTTKEGMIPKIQRQLAYIPEWNRCYEEIEDGAVVLLQHPFHHKHLTRERILTKLKEEKHVRYICFVHDVEELRAFRYNDYYRQEFAYMMQIADVLIVHNEVMLQYFVEQGCPKEKLVNLQIFDYLNPCASRGLPQYEKAITVAGNLDTTKCEYIGQLGQLKETTVNLYGPNYDERMRSFENVHYLGVYPPDEVPKHLTAGFGLVWDGNSLNGCQGQAGQYLRYNNPHKLSLYLSSGLPVVIWKGAAEAAFVEQHGVGICVESILDLEKILQQLELTEYERMAKAVADISARLRSGHYATVALEKADCALSGGREE